MRTTEFLRSVPVLTFALICYSAVGGWTAYKIGVPLPWMIGALFFTGLIAVNKRSERLLQGYKFPNDFRQIFIALIGVMIGTQVTPEVMEQAVELPWTITALALFVALAHLGNMLIFLWLGGYDRATACFSATPGGLTESIMFGEEAGADMRVLTAQQFLRIIVVVTALPFGLSLWLGHPVGSAAGMSFGNGTAPSSSPGHIALILGAALLGLWLGPKLRLPAPPLTGPMLIAAPLTVTGVLDLQLPFWLISLAQIVIGGSLGLRFVGMSAALLRKALWLAIISVAFMLGLAWIFAIALNHVTGIEILPLVLSFAPGGVTEMSLIALSLAASPALISVHHIIRIILTIIEVTLVAKWMGLKSQA